jgi:hypothetical protein
MSFSVALGRVDGRISMFRIDCVDRRPAIAISGNVARWPMALLVTGLGARLAAVTMSTLSGATNGSVRRQTLVHNGLFVDPPMPTANGCAGQRIRSQPSSGVRQRRRFADSRQQRSHGWAPRLHWLWYVTRCLVRHAQHIDRLRNLVLMFGLT